MVPASPQKFTPKVAEAGQACEDLSEFCKKQSGVITGSAEDKAREAAGAEAAAHPIARAQGKWFLDQKNETSAAKVDFSLTALRRRRDQELLAQLNTTLELAQGVTGGTLATTAADYGLTVAKVTALSKGVADFRQIINAPQSSIADRKVLTTQMRAKFKAVAQKFAAMDDLIPNVNSTATGQALVAAYQAARVVRDFGGSPGTPTPASKPTS